MGDLIDRLRNDSVTFLDGFVNSGVLSVARINLDGLSIEDAIEKLDIGEIVRIEPLWKEILVKKSLPLGPLIGPRCYVNGRIMQVIKGCFRDVMMIKDENSGSFRKITLREYHPGDIVIYTMWSTAIPDFDEGSIFISSNFGNVLAVNNGEMEISSPGKHIELMLESNAKKSAVNYAINLLIAGNNEKEAMKRLAGMFYS
ncbi:MAG: hypothetical protein Q8Q42_02150 [Nanoarchaeota archaeon]|nr:hypothetical protein [Nanoarchaeota archaeon]